MTTSLRTTIHELSRAFAAQLLDALRATSLDEILAEARGGAPAKKTGKAAAPAKAPARTRATTVQQIVSTVTVDAIVSILKKHKGGLRAELLRKELGAAKPAFNYHASKAIAEGKIRKTGQKRATTYFAK